jgi:hypothetical protein
MTALKTTSTIFNDPIVSQTDAAELQRLAQTQGLGEPLFDEETHRSELDEMFQDLGMDVFTEVPNDRT